jgi:hypothetical protein
LNATIKDLRAALADEAAATAHPNADDLIAGAMALVESARRRRRAIQATAAVAGLAAAGLVVGPRLGPHASSVPAGSGPFIENARGGTFPVFSAGTKRLLVLDAPMLERLKGSVTLHTTPGRELFVRMTCTPDNIKGGPEEWDLRTVARILGPGHEGRPHCGVADVPAGSDRLGEAMSDATKVPLDIFVSHAEVTPGAGPSFKDARVHLAFYESVPWSEYQFPPRPADVETNPDLAWPQDGVLPYVTKGPRTLAQANTPLTFTVPFHRDMSVDLQVRGPGRVKLAVNGTILRDPLGAQTSMVGDYFAFYEYAPGGMGLPADPGAVPVPGSAPTPYRPLAEGTPMTITITPQDFTGPDWRVQVVTPQQ